MTHYIRRKASALHWFPAILVWLASCPDLHAEWSWNNDEAETSREGDRFVAMFHFHNAGTVPVTVEELFFSCSCAEYSFKATPAEAGKDGTLRVSFSGSTIPQSLDFFAIGSGSVTAKQLTVQVQTEKPPP